MGWIDQIVSVAASDPVLVYGVLAVLLAIVVRVYFGDVVFSPRYVRVWGLVRRIGVPILDRLVRNRLGIDAGIHYRIPREHGVARVEWSWTEVADRMARAESFEVPLLAGYKTDWEGRAERGNLVSYHGPKMFPGAPNWLRSRQLHVMFFEDESGNTIVAAHEEANSYRIDLWADHLFAKSMNVEEGQNRTMDILRRAVKLENLRKIE